MSRQIVIYKAAAITRDDEVEDLIIRAECTPPENVTFKAAQELYRRQAQQVVNALGQTLPGGLLHQVLVELLIQKACVLRVPDHVAQPNAAGFVESFAKWWEEAGRAYYSDDGGLSGFYRDACVMLGREPQETEKAS